MTYTTAAVFLIAYATACGSSEVDSTPKPTLKSYNNPVQKGNDLSSSSSKGFRSYGGPIYKDYEFSEGGHIYNDYGFGVGGAIYKDYEFSEGGHIYKDYGYGGVGGPVYKDFPHHGFGGPIYKDYSSLPLFGSHSGGYPEFHIYKHYGYHSPSIYKKYGIIPIVKGYGHGGYGYDEFH
ncbi:hypothetical protein J6590_027877 [Homalodisca vitripennis]|nr:hypothetical protein J6590_027877 [Homalodisca vitripennis]